MKISTFLPLLAIGLSTTGGLAGCGGGPAAPAATATLSGVVAASGRGPIPGATVSVGGSAATTGADGSFLLQGLAVGSATVTASAPRFEARTQGVQLGEGPNSLQIELADQTIYTHGEVRGYLPSGTASYRAAIVFLPGLRDPATGNPLDSRDLVSGTWGAKCSIWCLPATLSEVRSRSLALAEGAVALIGTTTLVDQPSSYAALLQALSSLGAQSDHPELGSIPLLFVGHSMGGCTAYGFTRAHAERVAGFVTMKGGCHNPGPAQAAGAVPGYFLIGGIDAPYRAENITGVFEAGRAEGAPWALSVDPLQHDPMADLDQMFEWMEAVLAARLPATPGAPLRALTEASGWLGDRSNGAIAPFPCYGAAPSRASWLPSRETALYWQRMAGGSVVVSGC